MNKFLESCIVDYYLDKGLRTYLRNNKDDYGNSCFPRFTVEITSARSIINAYDIKERTMKVT